MSKKKKVVVTTPKRKPAPTVSKRTGTAAAGAPKEELIFDKSNYMWMGIGIALILAGMLLMTGGSMPSPDVWDDSIIYSTRITVIAPIFILAGLAVEIYAIFKD